MAVQLAKSQPEKAAAYYQLGTFHDNNNRESKAIPYYKQALRRGLEQKTKANALAWLSSSLYKTGKAQLALRYLKQAKHIARDKTLIRFIGRLIKRIEKS